MCTDIYNFIYLTLIYKIIYIVGQYIEIDIRQTSYITIIEGADCFKISL